MKRIVLLFALLFTGVAISAGVTDVVKSLVWNAAVRMFVAQTGVSGAKFVPAQEQIIITNPPCNTCTSGTTTLVFRFTRMGNVVTACVSGFATRTSGSSGTINVQSAIPTGWAPMNEQWFFLPGQISSVYALRLGRFAADNQFLLYADAAASGFSASATVNIAGGSGANACTSYPINQ